MRNDTLINWYESQNNLIKNSSNQLLKSANRECVEEKIKLSELGNNFYETEDYIEILIIKAFELCVENQEELWKLRVEEYLQELRYGWYNEDESIECLKKKIKETEPYASIAMADDEKSVNLENCYVEPQLEWSHDLFNEKASPFPCFVKSRNAVNFDNFFYKLRILEFGNLNDEIRKIEIENIGKLLKKMSEMNYKCLIKYID